MRTFLRHPRRVWQVLSVFGRYIVAPALPFRRSVPLPRPVRMRMALERLGGAWIKLGQMLAMRFDLLPVAYCDELFKLLNQVRPFPYEQVAEIIRKELGGPPEAVFASFERESFAAASIGQVHRAVLHSGEKVAVKVQRPGIRQVLQADISLMYSMTWLIDRTHLFGATRSREVINEFARWTADELDYLVEARQAVLLYDQARGERLEKIARVYRRYTTSRVLTAELIDGVPLIDIVVALRENNQRYLRDLEERGYDLNRVIRHMDWNMLNQVHVFGRFHADLHPANLFVLPGDAIGYVDFGIIGHLPNRVRDSLTRYGWLLFQGEVEAAIGELMRWLSPTAASDAEGARRQLIRAHQAFLYDAVGGTAGFAAIDDAGMAQSSDNPYSKLAVDIMKVIRDYELNLSQHVVAYLKMLVTLGTLRHQLATNYDLPSHVRRFFSGLIRQRSTALLDPRLSLGRAYAAGVRVQRAMEFVEFLEAQEPVIAEAEASLFGFRNRMRRAKRRLISVGAAALVVGGALYFVLANPQGTRDILPREVPYEGVHIGLLLILILLIGSLVMRLRGFGQEE